ncbi:porin family protein [Olivibacter sitiensis]|uniref:porin family protein n=1 Tax=Olivibacter sitiensis TaxID=376470 RepID=UPI0004864FA1|nr:porin family protein [Olivibacter sitiensis]
MTKPLSWFIFLLLQCMVYSGVAQEVHLIPQIGVNLGTYNFDKTLNNTSQQRLAPGLTAGVGFNIAFSSSRDFILQPEINYSMRNSITDFISTGQTTDPATTIRQKTQLHYIDIPLLARFDFGVSTRYYINVGPSISYAFAGRESYESSTIANFDNISRKADFNEKFNRIDWGVWLGGGVEIPVNDSFLLLDGRYGIGMRDLYKNMSIPGAGSEETAIGNDGRSRLFHITVGYALPL